MSVRVRYLIAAMTVMATSLTCHSQDVASLDASVRAYVNEQTTPNYRYAWVPLSDNSSDDALVLLQNGYCGSAGCTLIVLRHTDKGMRVISSSTISKEPIGILEETQHGMRTLMINTGGKGEVLMRFNGSKYPLNPSTQPLASKTQWNSAQIVKLQNRLSANS
jgi:hypothetical protein